MTLSMCDRTCSRLTAVLVTVALSVGCGQATDSPAAEDVEWRVYAGTNAALKYAPLDQVNRDTVENLRIAWRQSATPVEARRGLKEVVVPNNYQNTPIMVGGLLYMMTGVLSVAALDAENGNVVWVDIPPEQAALPPLREGEAPQIVDRRSIGRGVAYWTDGEDARVVAISGHSLIALNAETGARDPTFGDGGKVDLTHSYDPPVDTFFYGNPPVIVRDVIVVAGTATRAGRPVPSDIRGFDVRTGEQLWTFHVVPRPGEFGQDTWLNDSWENAGGAGTWSLMSADDELGYVYIPGDTTVTSNDFYGGGRPGTNLFEHSIICLDATTGERVWHFQTIRHGLWDWDLPAAPNLVDITVDGRRIKALAQVSKISYVYVLDRVTGEPVWPIEERSAPQGDVPGEWYSPTQPHPTKPPPYDRQDLSLDDLLDFTPELREEALKIVSQYRLGPLFTPPSLVEPGPDGKKGTIMLGTSQTTWPGAGVDPETGILFVTSVHSPRVIGMLKASDPDAPDEWIVRKTTPEDVGPGDFLLGPQGLPDPFKPPYGRFVAIDLNEGEILWTVANGDGPRNHPALEHLDLPPLGQGGRAAPLVTKDMVFLGEGGPDVPGTVPGSGGKIFRAYDKSTGDVLWEMELPGGTTGAPMTYMLNGKQYVVVAVGAQDSPGELVALALP